MATKRHKRKNNHQNKQPSHSVRVFKQFVWFGLVSLQCPVNLWEKTFSRKNFSFSFPALKVKNEHYRAQCYRRYANGNIQTKTPTDRGKHVNMQNLQLPNLQSNWFSCKPLFLFICLPPCRLLFSTPTCEQKPLCGICSNYLHGQAASGMYLEYFSYLFQCSLAAWDEHSQPGHFLAVQLQRLLWPSVWEQLTLMILGCTLSVLSAAV